MPGSSIRKRSRNRKLRDSSFVIILAFPPPIHAVAVYNAWEAPTRAKAHAWKNPAFSPPISIRSFSMIRSHFSCYCILCAVLGLALVWLFFLIPTAAYAQEPKGPVSFINDVAPILQKNCFACHDAKKKKGKLDMTIYESFRKGGSKDDPIVPGKAKESLIIDLLTGKGAERMPPKDAGD